MSNVKKRRFCIGEEDGHVGAKKASSSYEILKSKYASCQLFVDELLGTVKFLQTELQGIRLELQGIQLAGVVSPPISANVLVEMEALKAENMRLELGRVAFRIEREELTNKITILSDEYDVMNNKLDEYVLKEREDMLNSSLRRRGERDSKRAVLRAFGWKLSKVNPTMLRAACGFWNATIDSSDCGPSRASLNRRIDIWIDLSSHGFNGMVKETMEKQFYERAKFNVVEICRKSDCESQFNAGALQSMSNCQTGKKKYDRGLLCSDSTLRRMQKKVHGLAERLGFSSLPIEEKGNVWCWGDAQGNFVTAVNRYVYEIYVKARCPLVTREDPWMIPITGDLARVNFRGKAITMGGPKRADPRLPCQQKTMKTSNQSREMYTPAVAGYVDEGHIMPYFKAMVAAFDAIEEQGYCVVDGISHTVYICVVVGADMAFLHKYTGRGGGSHASTHFCFLCSIPRKSRAEGYPGGCLKCRKLGIVYDETTGCQKCGHHDVCCGDFLKWQTERVLYLTENVLPRIPKSARPFYENKDALKIECLKRCDNDAETREVHKKKTIGALEKWLKADGRTREGCDLSCNIHTGIRICPMALVKEDLRLRHISHGRMKDSDKRRTLELLLREEEEYLKVQMYLRDDRFSKLAEDPSHSSGLHKIVLDVLHMPMRTNEKVLTMLYDEVTQGAHKAQASIVFDMLTPIFRRLGDLGELWTHQFDDNNSKVIKKFKLPHDQSRKIFAVHQLEGLREAVNVAIPSVPACNEQLRKDWMLFLDEYVHVNQLLESTDDYSLEDITRLEKHMDSCYYLLVSRIGGAEKGVTNYFHQMGSGHAMWMIKRYGNLWRYCMEGAESMNSMLSKRYNLFNNKGGNKQSHVGGPKKKCLPFEVLGAWLGRLSVWHTGIAVDYLHDLAWTCLDWGIDSKIEWSTLHQCYVLTDEEVGEEDSDRDSDWDGLESDVDEKGDETLGTISMNEVGELTWTTHPDDKDIMCVTIPEDVSWLQSNATVTTWYINEEGTHTSARTRYQHRPVEEIE